MAGILQQETYTPPMIKPNFFIVGAPKCGTTAMDHYLKQHPDIFMAQKSLDFFGADLPLKMKRTEAEYLSNFIDAYKKKIVGDASVFYLYSRTAAYEIRALSPEAKILIMLRNPVILIHALHSQNIYEGNEDEADFEKAIQLDEERKKGDRQPKCADFTFLPPYKDIALFSEQVKRYLDVFGKEKVHIIIYEEFAKDPETSTKEVLTFLGVDPGISIQYKVINPNKKIRFLFLHRLIKTPATWLRPIVRFLIPVKRIRHKIMSVLQENNIAVSKRNKMNPETEKDLKTFFADDIAALSKLINRDLMSIWE
ncbi:MAG: sulfotransferase [Chitinophagaceae bacterium]|nr:sulfotransferase [Chitinophagaceae bacterium]